MRLAEGKRRFRACTEIGQIILFLLVRPAQKNCLRCKGRAHKGARHHGATHLLYNRHDFSHSQPDATKLFRYGNR